MAWHSLLSFDRKGHLVKTGVILVLISGTILVTPVLEMITDYYFVYPYRYVPLVVFFAIGLSTLFSKK